MARCIGWCRASPPICWRGIDRLDGLNAPHLILGKILAQAYDTAAYKIAADDLLAAHKVDILFHALGAGVVMLDEKRINVLMVETKAGRRAVRAGIFIDCSGDGDLAAWAGAPFEVGDNAGSMLYPSMMLRLNGIDPEKAGDAWRTIPALMEKAEAAGTHRFPRKTAIVRPQRHQIEWRVNFTQLAREDGTAISGIEPDDLTRGEIRGRRQAVQAFEFLRTVPGLKNPTSSICRRSSASARRARDRRLHAVGRGRARLRLVRRLHRRQWLADGTACRWRCDLHVSADPGIARLQRIAVSHAGAGGHRQSPDGRALRLDDP
jgi:hypothetical protein